MPMIYLVADNLNIKYNKM